MLNQMIYAGKTVAGQGIEFEVLNPATETTITACKSASREQVDIAVAAAKQAFSTWQHTADSSVKAMLEAIAADIAKERSEIARLISLEQGKPLAMAEMEVDMGLYWLQVTNNLEIPVLEERDPMGKTMQVFHRPLGVVASITPWNWPFMIAIWHIIPALKAKNCVINKPSEYTPLSTIYLIEIINRHLPAGVCNVLLGAGEVGAALSSHVDVEKVTFTGSTPVGQQILAASVDTLRSVVLELGGNDAAIVCDDVDVESVAEKIFMGAFLNAGQTCACIKRLYVHENIYDALLQKLAAIADQQVLGNGLDTGTTMGPLQNVKQYTKVKNLIAEALEQGASIANQKLNAVPAQGYFIAPTILTNVAADSAIFATEQFGPVLPVVKFSNLEEVIQQANQLAYGLGGSIWSSDLNKAQQAAAQMQTGSVWINSHADVSPFAAFGGWKMSGLGYSFGLDGLLLFTRKQAIHFSV
ncbi:acyl-CoA reductase-like NAD-dependent aldehyde dehydrogenase [Acinetobacter calcoaceticus]|uniref:Acyl-CoA reductase-like NAD-dependent aldehyde dehydrogenase n=1 Tax=Acinetobacter calcoaceticus TaxID=471 RepID=A0A4R1XKK8_ACICA|nr:acyl-CoA reductase-like NAD-dependent aldehyde dehydrogenase [Acinetobacter calcoaceticus]